ncbi:unnamed protein product, partial [Brenthis ino]
MAKAIQAVVKGEMSMYAAAKIFRIPTTTLFGRIKKNSRAPKVGRPLAIPLSCEQRLADAIATMEKWGFGLTRQEKPDLIWNLDETSLCLDPTKTKVVGKINKPCSRTTCGTGKENITVLAAVSATGKKITPLIVYKGKQVWDQWMAKLEGFDFEILYAASSRGWMETNIFYNYLEKILIPELGKERPVLLIFDGHSTHVDANVVELAVKNNITILKLPPHTSHLLQPLDVAVFKSFKSMWDKKLVEWQRHNVCRTPKSLRSLCNEVKLSNSKSSITSSTIDISDPLKEDTFHILTNTQLNIENVTMLSDLSDRKDSQLLPFMASQTASLPQCLQEEKESSVVSFEELVLEKIQQGKHNIPLKRKRVAKGAEVITLNILKNNKEKEQIEKHDKKLKKPKTKLESMPSSSKSHNTSFKKIKRRSSAYSISGLMTDDILNTNENISDFDIVAWADSDAIHMDNELNKENISEYNLSQAHLEIEKDQYIKKTFCSRR